MPVLDKVRLRRELERERKSRVRVRLLELRREISDARTSRNEGIKAIRTACNIARHEAATRCGEARALARSDAKEAIEALRKKRRELGRTERTYAEVDQRNRKRGPVKAVQRAESDDEVVNNLPPDLVPVFRKVRRSIKGGARISRTEAFLGWAEENPGEVFHLQDLQAESDLKKLLAEQRRLHHERATSTKGVPF